MNYYQPRAPHPRRPAAQPCQPPRSGDVTQRAINPGRTPDDRVQPEKDHLRVVAAQGLHLGGQPRLDPFDGRLARLDQQLAAVASDVEAQEVHPVVEVDDGRFGLVEGQTPGLQPRGKPCLDLLGLVTRVTKGERESRRGESHPPPLAEPCGSLSAYTAPIVQPSGLRPKRQWANNPG